ncbi:MAG: hypothetical protein DWQ07_06230 [Chloroflexi bacterium]|nr:MAG: hypothetical protein DWQ07_06230 [Chloroflexota bacterium]MBL1195973.1 hypothetical protein [Chloroflexota bacterium]NOH13267.1 hypothetical protein [Chloroflexota bacterium]
MKTLNISLRALSSPLSLFSIGLLLLNDHLLKAYYPSALTGKISDFAGLFFFPILLTVFLSIPLERLKLRHKQIAFIAYAITLVWFSLIKTSPQINLLTIDLLSSMLGYATSIVLDPTDLIALLSLWPSWKLLQSIPAEGTSLPRRAYPIAALAILATMATSPALSPQVYRIAVSEEKVYALGSALHYNPYTNYAVSEDNGYTWNPVEDLPAELDSRLDTPVEFPKTVCILPNKLDCYRITGKDPEVLVTTDGGESWSITWELPADRSLFASRTAPAGFTPRDIDIIYSDEYYNVIAAMGPDGVLLGNHNGEWQRVAVLNTSPSPLFSDNLSNAILVIQFEISALIYAGLITLLLSTLFFIGRVMAKDKYFLGQPEEKTIVRDPLFLFSALPLFFYSIIGLWVLVSQWQVGGPTIFAIIHTLLMILFIFGAVWTWKRLIGATSFPNESQELRKISIAIAIITPTIATIPFILWTFGTIYNYNHALTISIVLFAAILIVGFRLANQVTRNLPEEPDVTP